MENVFSNLPPEPTRMSLKLELTIPTSEQMPDFNNLFQEGVSKMMRVTDDLHLMVDYIRDFRNMMIGFALLTIIGILMHLILKYQNGKQQQKRRRRSNRDKYRSDDIRSENSTIGNQYMNENSAAHSDGSFDDVLISGECCFRTNDINEFADHKSRKCSNITKPPSESEPKSIQCCENTFESSWKFLQHLKEKHDLNLYRDASTTDNSQERRGPQTPSPIPSESVKSEQNHPITLIMNNDQISIPALQLTIPMSTVPTSIPYYSDSTAAAYGTPPLTTSVSAAAKSSVSSRSIRESHYSNNNTVGDISNSRNVKLAKNMIRDITNARDVNLGTSKQTTFNQNTTNFIVCSLDSLKPFDV